MALANNRYLFSIGKPQIAMKRLVSCYSDLVVACAAINRAIILGYEWHLCLGSALSTNDCVHFAWTTITIAWTRRTATRCPAFRTPTRLIHQTFLLVKLLFTSCECEVVSTFATPKGFVFETQLGTSLWYVGIPPGPYLSRCHQLSVTPSSAGLNVLEEHCMPDQDRIPHASIHHKFEICKSFVNKIRACT